MAHIPAPTAKAARVTSIQSFPAGPWKDDLILNSRSEPKALLANAITAFRGAHEFQSALGFDSFAMRTIINRPLPWNSGRGRRVWTPLDDALATDWLQHEGIGVGVETTQAAIEAVAQDHPFHPIREYLDGLVWDGVPRIDRWLSTYLGAGREPFVETIGARFLISAVARVRTPGCQADHILVIEGPQGTGKSSALKCLGGEWFSDEIAELGTKDAALQVQGGWIFELSELDAMTRAEIAKTKAFISRRTDRFRPPYGRRVIEVPRSCVFAGTTNAATYLRDETGARRFWPIRAGAIDLDGIKRDRDQLWAEAALRFREGCPWWLNEPASAQQAERAQGERYTADPWDELLQRYMKSKIDVSIEEIFQHVLVLDKSHWKPADANRIARSLKVAGFERYQKRTEDGRQWRYRRREPEI